MTASIDLTLEEWLTATEERRDELDKYSMSPLPADISERHADTDECIQSESDACRLLADAESYLSQFKAQSVLAIKDKYPDLSAKEREVMLKDSIRDVQRLVDGLAVTAKTLSNRRFHSMNANRSRL